MADRGASNLHYMPKLDGLRAIAIAFVLLQHFGPDRVVSAIGAGGLGVRLFFVLSGYLITAILLGYRQSPLRPTEASLFFYWRRFLRLAPPLYAAIAVAVVLNIAGMRHDWWWGALYLYNVLVVIRSSFGPAGHLWTLAVEEQFYLLWPLIVLLFPRRALKAAVLALILLGPAYRGGLYLSGMSNFPQVLLPGNIDSLALGALMSISQMDGQGRIWRAISRPAVFAVGVVGLVALTAAFGPLEWPRRVLYPCFVNLAAASAVAACAQSDRSGLGWLAAAPLRHVGQISYGLYVYHYFLPLIAKAYVPPLAAAAPAVRDALYLCASFLAAELSWRVLERPLRRWRRQVPGLSIREPAQVRA